MGFPIKEWQLFLSSLWNLGWSLCWRSGSGGNWLWDEDSSAGSLLRSVLRDKACGEVKRTGLDSRRRWTTGPFSQRSQLRPQGTHTPHRSVIGSGWATRCESSTALHKVNLFSKGQLPSLSDKGWGKLPKRPVPEGFSLGAAEESARHITAFTTVLSLCLCSTFWKELFQEFDGSLFPRKFIKG